MSVISNFGSDSFITFKEDTHQYFGDDGYEYTPVSTVLKTFSPKFDAEKTAYYVAKREGKTQKQILEHWDYLRERSSNYGTKIHNALELYGIQGYHDDPIINDCGKKVNYLLGPRYKEYEEKQLYSIKHKVAGTTDKCTIRNRALKDIVLDLSDYKTNLQGLKFHTIKIREDKSIKFYNRFMLDVVSHLEATDFIKYCLQLSIYSYMAEITYGLKIGRTFIIYIHSEFDDNDNLLSLNPQYLPVPYMKLEAKAMLDRYIELKPVA